MMMKEPLCDQPDETVGVGVVVGDDDDNHHHHHLTIIITTFIIITIIIIGLVTAALVLLLYEIQQMLTELQTALSQVLNELQRFKKKEIHQNLMGKMMVTSF